MFIATDIFLSACLHPFFKTPPRTYFSFPLLPKKKKKEKSPIPNPFRVARTEWWKLRRKKKKSFPKKKKQIPEKKRNDKNIYMYIYILKRRRLKHWEQLPPQPPPLQRSSQIRISIFPIFHFSTEFMFDTKHDILRLRNERTSERASEPLASQRVDMIFPCLSRGGTIDSIGLNAPIGWIYTQGLGFHLSQLVEQFVYNNNNNKSWLILCIFDFFN